MKKDDISEMKKHLICYFSNETELEKWLDQVNPAFSYYGNMTTREMINSGITEPIWRMIHQIDAGVAN